MSFVAFEERGHIGILTINRPEVLNALNTAVFSELTNFLDKIAESSLRCLVVTGAGEKAFVAGADIREMKDLDAQKGEQFSVQGNTVMEKQEQLPLPTIAAVNGFTLGGGCELALAFDIRFASEHAVFAMPETSFGILPGHGGIQRLTRVIGIAKTKEMVFTTNRVKAAEALALGLVNAVYPAEELLAAALQTAEKIASNAPAGIRAAKKIANAGVGLTISESARLEAPLFGSCFCNRGPKTGDGRLCG
ncbi:enoyl-CoA hydratase [Spirochaetia bacterium]|nr:enoyl-CoA hydratase [Spirochaetia bacterium]